MVTGTTINWLWCPVFPVVFLRITVIAGVEGDRLVFQQLLAEIRITLSQVGDDTPNRIISLSENRRDIIRTCNIPSTTAHLRY